VKRELVEDAHDGKVVVLSVKVPRNAPPGTSIKMEHSGKEITVIVPPGSSEGMSFKVQLTQKQLEAAPVAPHLRPTVMHVTVPDGLVGGGHVEVQHAGKRIMVNVPANAAPGSTLEISLTPAMIASAPEVNPAFAVQVPAGVTEGMHFRFRLPNGQVTSVVVPPGKGAGDMLQVRV
jgi:hypothetical protein